MSNSTRSAFVALSKIRKYSGLNTKLILLCANVLYMLLYGSGTWKVIPPLTQRLQVFVNTSLRRSILVFWPQGSNIKLNRRTGRVRRNRKGEVALTIIFLVTTVSGTH